MHAKLQRREAVWILTDMGSTNGTFVEGDRLAGETPLSPGTTLRFGDVIALFEPLDDRVPAGRAGSTQLLGRLDPEAVATRQMAEKPRRQAPKRPLRMAPPRPKGPSATLVTFLLILMAILAYLLLS
jgi:pSer/pThr/pTyr-binding forkhead associated (FHA) protein